MAPAFFRVFEPHVLVSVFSRLIYMSKSLYLNINRNPAIAKESNISLNSSNCSSSELFIAPGDRLDSAEMKNMPELYITSRHVGEAYLTFLRICKLHIVVAIYSCQKAG